MQVLDDPCADRQSLLQDPEVSVIEGTPSRDLQALRVNTLQAELTAKSDALKVTPRRVQTANP